MENFKGEVIIKPDVLDKHTIEHIGNSVCCQLFEIDGYSEDDVDVLLEMDHVLIIFK